MARRPRSGAAGSRRPADGAAPEPRQQAEVTVRMYRQGIGDCFLLTFPREGARPLFMLIDCGVLLGTEDQNGWMRRVAENIRQTAKGHIDILVATHEHWDHLSGFLQAQDVFDRIEVGELWLAWTEDPTHELAQKLRRQREEAHRALVDLQLRLAAAGSPDAEALRSVLEFSGPLAAAGRATIEDALPYLCGKVARPPRYCRPGAEPLALPGVPNVRVYVLGPPESEKLIRRSRPTKTGREVYELALGPELDAALLAAAARADDDLDGLGVDDRRAYELSLPFDMRHRIPVDDARADPFFEEIYFGSAAEGTEGDRWSWRRIETDWLGAARDLALRLDSHTNNTSLALAIELSPGGDVLLFPGDAQVGNWLSWAELVWPKGAKPEDAGAVTAESLLARTVLYKVGHHASHNATLREQGLELMVSPDLVAMIPVDETMAREKKRWDMPFGPLLRRLEERTRGRVIRADRPASALKAAPKPARLSGEEWRDFCGRLAPEEPDAPYVEYRFPIAGPSSGAPARRGS